MILVRITAPHFVAGLIVGHEAAPILKYMKAWELVKIRDYCKHKGWGYEVIDDGKDCA